MKHYREHGSGPSRFEKSDIPAERLQMQKEIMLLESDWEAIVLLLDARVTKLKAQVAKLNYRSANLDKHQSEISQLNAIINRINDQTI